MKHLLFTVFALTSFAAWAAAEPGAPGTVTIQGSVARPGIYSISGRDVRASEIVVGATPAGDDDVTVEVTHPNGNAAPLEVLPPTPLADLKKDQKKDVILNPGDVISVAKPPAK